MGYTTIQERVIRRRKGGRSYGSRTGSRVNHDVDDALRAGIISWDELPEGPLSVLGEKMSVRIDTLVRDMISSSEKQGEIIPSEPVYEALMQLRAWLFRNVYGNRSRGRTRRPPAS